MNVFQKGSKGMKVFVAVVIVGLVGAVGWYVYDQNKTDSNSTTKISQSETTEAGTDYNTVEGMKYTVPKDWKNTNSLSKDAEAGLGQYLLSSDFKESASGQLEAETGASIYFGKLSVEGISSDTSLEQAAEIVKKDENGSVVTESVKITTVLDKQVLMFRTSVTGDNESAYYKSPSGQWYGIFYTAATIESDSKEFKPNPNYQTFLSWLKDFIRLNP